MTDQTAAYGNGPTDRDRAGAAEGQEAPDVSAIAGRASAEIGEAIDQTIGAIGCAADWSYRQARHAVAGSRRMARSHLTERPLLSVLVIASAGFLLGWACGASKAAAVSHRHGMPHQLQDLRRGWGTAAHRAQDWIRQHR